MRVRRNVSALAVVFLVAASVAGGWSPAVAADPFRITSPTLDQVVDFTTDFSLSVTGEGQHDGDPVSVTITDENDEFVASRVIESFVDDSWSASFDLDPGEYIVSAFQDGAEEDQTAEDVPFTVVVPQPVVTNERSSFTESDEPMSVVGSISQLGGVVTARIGEGDEDTDEPDSNGDWDTYLNPSGQPYGSEFTVEVFYTLDGFDSDVYSFDVTYYADESGGEEGGGEGGNEGGDSGPAPSVSCDFFPGGVDISTDGEDELSLYYYTVAIGGGDYRPVADGTCNGEPVVIFAEDDRVDYQDAGSCTLYSSEDTCTREGLAPGIHEFDSQGPNGYFEYYWRVPYTPTITSTVPGPGTLTLSGKIGPEYLEGGMPDLPVEGNTVVVTDADSNVLCETPPIESGDDWECTVVAGASENTYFAYQVDAASGGESPTQSVAASGGTLPVEITSLDDGDLVTDDYHALTGTSSPYEPIDCSATDASSSWQISASSTDADADGEWTCVLSELGTHEHAVFAASDAHDQSDEVTASILLPPDVYGFDGQTLVETSGDFSITGYAAAEDGDDTVVECRLIDDDDVERLALGTLEGGNYSCDFTAVPNDVYALTVIQRTSWSDPVYSTSRTGLEVSVETPSADPNQVVRTEAQLENVLANAADLDPDGEVVVPLESIILGRDIVATSNAILTIPAGITLDLAGYALTTRAIQLETFTTVLDAAHGGAGDTLEVALTIEDTVGGGQLTAASGTNTYRAAIRTSGSSLLITGGTVFAYGDKGGAGIGGDPQSAGGDLFITGGTVVADSTETGAGIGGGGLPYDAGGPSGGGSAGRVWIEGTADVTATARNGAAIGAGFSGTIGEVRISGNPTVVATSSVYGAGIGGGGYSYNASGKIYITGGTVTATGGASPAGAGIGTGGYSGTPGVIDITIGAGADVTVVNGSGASAVGNGTGASQSGEISVSIDGILRIPADANLDVPLGTNFVVEQTGVISGTGTITGDGHIDNNGSITVANDNVSVAVYNHNYNVTFSVNDGETDNTAHEQVLAASFADGDREIPTSFDGETDIADSRPGFVFRGWNSEVDGSGLTVEDDTDISSLAVSSFAPGAASIALYAQWESEASALVVTGPDGGGFTFEAVIGEPLPLSGSAAPGSTISVYVGGEEICAEASMSDGGVWSCIVPASTIDSIVGTAGITIVQRGLDDTYNEAYSIHVDPTIAVTGDDGFAAAIAAAGISTILLTGDTNYGAGLLSLPRTMTIDLAGHTLTTASIDIFDGGSLTVRSTVDGLGEVVAPAGRLDANAGLDAAGIQTSGAALYIQSGTVDATGNGHGAGIGGDSNGGVNAGTVEISGGTVTAIGGSSGTGIGGGIGGAGGEVTVGDGLENGPAVTATGGTGAPGVGNGYNSTGTAGSLAVDFGATVTVSGGNGASAFGAASGASGDYDELSVAGELVIGSALRVAAAGLTTVEESGVISGAGSLEGTGTVSNWGSITVATVTADVDYNKHALVFHDNFGADATQTVTIYADSFSNANSDLAPPTTTRTGWLFRGWNTQADGEGADLCLEDAEGCEVETTFESDSSDQAFYALWAQEELRITATVDGDAVEEHASLQAGTEITLTVTAYDPESGAELGDRTDDVVFREGNDYRTSNPFTLENAAESESLWVELRTDYSVKGEFVITVTPGDFYQLLIDPDQTGDLPAGTAVHYSVYSFDEYGNAIDGYVPDDIALDATDDSNPDITRECGYLECEIGRAGTYTVTATSAETGDGAPVATSTLTIVPGPVDSITLSPAASSIAVGDSLDFTIGSADVGGNDLGEVDDADLTLAGTGLDEQPIDTSAMTCDLDYCSPTVPGEYTVTAHIGEATDTAAISVVAGVLDEIRISQPEGDLAVGGTFFVNVSGYDVAGNVLDEIDDVAIAITADGVDTTGYCDGFECSPLKPGSYEITATVAGIEPATVTLQVVLGDLDSIVVTSNLDPVKVGQTVSFATEGFDPGSNSLGEVTGAEFSLSGVDADGDPIETDSYCYVDDCQPLTPGEYTMSATLEGHEDSVTFTVIAGDLYEIRISQPGASVQVGDSYSFAVTGFDLGGNPLGAVDDAEISITADGINTDGYCDGYSCAPLKPGSYEITATVDGIEPASATLVVELGDLHHIGITPVAASVQVGDSVEFTVTGYDIGDNSLGTIDDAVLAISADGVDTDGYCDGLTCVPMKPGTYEVTATADGVEPANTSLDVSLGDLDHIALTPVESDIQAGEAVDLAVEQFDIGDNSLGFTDDASLSLEGTTADGDPIDTESVPCDLTGCAPTVPGTYTVTARVGEAADTATITVTEGELHEIRITPLEGELAVGDSVTLEVTGYDVAGNVLAAIDDADIAIRADGVDTTGFCDGYECSPLKPGTYEITATVDGIEPATVTLEVVLGAVTGVTLTLDGSTYVAGDSLDYEVDLVDAGDNEILDPQTPTNFELDGEVCSIDGGCFTTDAGSHVLVAINNGQRSAEQPFTVSHGEPTSVEFHGPDGDVSADETTFPFTATGTDEFGNEFDVDVLVDGEVPCEGLGDCNWHHRGTHVVTVDGYEGDDGRLDFSTVIGAVTVTLAPIDTVTAGDEIAFDITARDHWYNEPLTESTIRVTPEGNGDVETCVTLPCVIETPGSYIAVAENDGIASDPQTFEVTTGTPASITLNVLATTVVAGTPVVATATVYDSLDNEVVDAEVTFTLDGVDCPANECTPLHTDDPNVLLASTTVTERGETLVIESEPQALNVIPATAKTLALSPATDGFIVDADATTLPISATATDSFGNTSAVQVAVDGYATCAPNEECTWRTAGAHTASATVTGTSGELTETVAFETEHGAVTRVELSDASTMLAGEVQPFSIAVEDMWGNPVTTGTTFTITPDSDGATSVCFSMSCTVNTLGSYVVRAENNGVVDTAELSVDVGPVASVTLTVPETITAGDRPEPTVVLRDLGSNVIDEPSTETTFELDGESCAIDGDCWATTVGSYELVALNNGVESSGASYTVEHADAETIAFEGDENPSADDTLTYTAVGTDLFGNEFDVAAVIPDDWRLVGEHRVTVAGYEDFAPFTTRIGALAVTLSEVGDVAAGDRVPFEVSAEDAWTNVSEQPSTITLAPSVADCTIGECVIENAGVYTATAHNDGVDSEPVTFEVVAGPATEVVLTVPDTTITAGDTLEYSAVARDAFGNELESAITYTLDGVPCAGAACSPTLVSAQNLLVASTLGDDDELIHSPAVDLTVTAAVAKTLSITSPATDENGDLVVSADASTLPFSATATDTYGNTTDVAITVDTVAPCAAGVDCVWRDAGSHTISATTPGLDGQLTANQAFTTVHGDAYTVELSAAEATVDAGDAQPLTVTVTDEWGNAFTDGTVISVAPKTGPPASVCSSLDCVISEPGVYELRASNGEAVDTADLTVVVGPVASVELTIADATLTAGQSLESTIVLEDKVGNTVTSPSTTTTVTRDGVVCQLASTCASTIVGDYSLIATNNGISSAAVSYTVTHATASTLAISGPDTVSADATALPFTAEATDTYGNTFDVAVLIDDATACGGTDPCDWRTAGVTHEVTAASGSVTASETFTTTVGSITDVELHASKPFIVAGAEQPFSITATDAWGNGSLAESTISIVDDESTVACNALDCVLTTPGLYSATAYNSGTASASVALEVRLGAVARVTLSGPSEITAGDDLAPIVTTYDSVDNVIPEGDRATPTTFELDGEPCDEGCSSTQAGSHTLVAVNNGIESNAVDYTVTASATVRTEIDGPAEGVVDADGIFPFSATAYDEWDNETAVTVEVDGALICDGTDCAWRTAGAHTVSAPGADPVTFTTTPGAVSNIVFEGEEQITAGDTQPYTVTATDTWGNEVDGTTVAITRGSTTFCESLSCTLSEPGEYTLTATNGITRAATFVVIVGEVAFVTIDPTETELVAGEQLGFSVLLEDSERNEITDADIVGQTVLTLDGVECDDETDCTSTTVRDEPYVVRATNNNHFDEFSYTVSLAAAGSVTLYGPAPVGGVIEIAADTEVFPFTATAIDLEGNAFEVDELLVDGEALCDDEGDCTWRTAGEHTVTVDIDGERDEATFTTIAGDASTVELTGDSTQITGGDAQPFGVIASDAYGNEITDGFTLSIDSDPACTAFDCTIDVPGSYTAIAYNDGVASPERTLTVVAGPVHSVDLSVQNTSIVAGESIGTVTITATDRVGNVLTGDDLPYGATLELDGVECAIDDCSPVDILAANQLRAHADGVASAIVTISVTAAQTERIEFTGSTTVDADATAFPLSATAFDAFDNATTVPVFVHGSTDAPCGGVDDCAWRTAGDHTVTAELDGVSDELAFETLAGAVTVVELSDESAQITGGDTQPFSVIVEDSWGNPIATGTTFAITSSNDTQVCSITTCRIDTPGEYEVTAANDGVTDSATLTVVASNIVGQVALTIDDAELVAGDELDFAVVTRDAVGNLITDPTTATTYLVDGTASAAASTIAGSHTLQALNNGFSSQIRTFTVAAGPATTVTINGPAAGSIVDPDEPFPFTALGDDGYTNTFAVEATVAGDWHAATAHTVTAASGTASASRTFTTRVGAIDHVTLVGSDEIVAGAVQPFQVVGNDAWQNDTQSGSTISISRVDGPEVCTSRTCTITTPGSYTATGINGGVSSPARQFTVVAGPLDHFTITPATDDVTAGDTTRYVAHGFDAHDNSVAAPTDVTLTVRKARNEVVSGVVEGLDVTIVTAGSYTITASSQQDADAAASPTATLTVAADELDEFTLTPADATATAGTQPPFTVTAVDQYGNGVGSTTVTFTARSDVDANNTCASSYPCAAGTYDVLAVNGDESRTAVLHVVAAAAASVAISPASAAMLVGESRTFSVAAVDAFGNPVSGTTISGPSGVTCAALSCTASAPGTFTITATNGTRTATATLTVTAVPAIVIDPGTTTGGTTIAVVSGDPTATSIAGTITGEIADGTRMAASMTAAGLGTYDWTCQGPDATGDWDCSLPPGAYPPGTYTLTVSATRGSQVVAQNSSLVVIVEPASTPAPTTTATPKPRPTVVPTSTATPSPSATPTRAPRTWSFTVGDGLGGKIKAGGEIDIYSEDVPEGTTGDVWLHSDPVFLGSTSVNADGIFRLKAKVPKEIPAGEHHIVITITVPGEEPIVSDTAITIDPADPDEESTGTPYLGTNTDDLATGDGGTAAGAGTDGGTAAGPNAVVTENERNEPDAVTALTKSVPSVLEIVASPVSIAVASGLTLAIMLLVALPTELLNSTLEAQSGRLGRRITRIEEAVNGGIERFNRRMRTPIIGALIIALITSIVFGFVDPEFGFDIASIRLVLSMGIAFFIVSYGASAITGRILGRTLNVASEISMQPFALIFAILGVVLARTLGFSPGFLVGLVVGLEIASQISRGQKLKATAVQLGVIVGLSIAAWLGYSLALAIQGETPLDFGSGLIQDALTAVVSEGLTAAFVGLLPLTYFDGKEIFDLSKKVWVGLYLFVGIPFVLLVLPSAATGQSVSDLLVWTLVMLGFTLLTFLIWGIARWRESRSPAEEAELVDVE